MVGDAALAPFLPTLETARAAGLPLPDGAPDEQHRLAALVVRAHIVRREGWEEEALVDEQRAGRLPRAAPPPPREFVEQTQHSIGTSAVEERCEECAGSRRQGCTVCGGKRRLWRVRLTTWRDQPSKLLETYLPSQVAFAPDLFKFERHLESIVGQPPEILRCHDLRTTTVGSAYRGGGRERIPDFHGHEFGDALERAGAAVSGILSAAVVLADIRAFAWPVLWLRWGDGDDRKDVAIHAHPEGHLGAFSGEQCGGAPA
jgi:hypothetical protein